MQTCLQFIVYGSFAVCQREYRSNNRNNKEFEKVVFNLLKNYLSKLIKSYEKEVGN